jgi:hypothetical protein
MMQIWRSLRTGKALLLTCLIYAVVAFLFWNVGPKLTNKIADYSFANIVTPSDREVAVTRWTPLWSTSEYAALAGRGEGLSCSLPQSVTALFYDKPPDYKSRATNQIKIANVNLQFRQACIAHDLCYRHGAATYGYTQSQCDTFLVEDAIRICNSIFVGEAKIEWCRTRARKVLGGVTFGGANAFRGLTLAAADEKTDRPEQYLSTIAEYDPYPSGAANYVVPRLIENGCDLGKAMPMLLSQQRRPGGSSFSRRCFETVGKATLFVKKDYLLSPNEIAFKLGPPWLVKTTTNWSLLFWCRDNTQTNATGGSFRYFDARSLMGATKIGCGDLPPGTGQPDPETTTLFPVVQAPDMPETVIAVHLQNLLILSTSQMQIGKDKRQWDRIFSGNLPSIAHAEQDSYRWYANPPLILPNKDGVEVVAFRRGDAAGKGYDKKLDAYSISLKKDGSGASQSAPAFSYALSEDAEPFIALPRLHENMPPVLLSLHRDIPKPSSLRWLFVVLIVAGAVGAACWLEFRWGMVPGLALLLIPMPILTFKTYSAFDVMPDFKRDGGNFLLETFKPGEPGNDPVSGERWSISTPKGSLEATSFLQNRISFVDDSAPCPEAVGNGKCPKSLIALLPAYQFSAKLGRIIVSLLRLKIDQDAEGNVTVKKLAPELGGQLPLLGKATYVNESESSRAERTITRMLFFPTPTKRIGEVGGLFMNADDGDIQYVMRDILGHGQEKKWSVVLKLPS